MVVLCQEAVAARDALIEKLAALPPVQAALDQILHRFGGEAVAEVTGRSRRVLRIADSSGERLALRNRPASANLAETAAFMAGDKRILVFSMAGGTGRSYHADLGCGNTARGVVTLTAIWPACGRRRRRLCNGRHLPPLSHRVAAELAECSAGDQMALDVEEVVDGRMDGEEPLRGRGRFEPLHLSLSSSHRLM